MENKIIGLTVTLDEANLIFDSLDKTSKKITELKERLYQDGLRQLALLNGQREPESQQEQEQIETLAEEMPTEKGENNE